MSFNLFKHKQKSKQDNNSTSAFITPTKLKKEKKKKLSRYDRQIIQEHREMGIQTSFCIICGSVCERGGNFCSDKCYRKYQLGERI